MSFFDHILDTLRAKGWNAKDLDTVKGYPEHDRARFQQMTTAECQAVSRSGRGGLRRVSPAAQSRRGDRVDLER